MVARFFVKNLSRTNRNNSYSNECVGLSRRPSGLHHIHVFFVIVCGFCHVFVTYFGSLTFRCLDGCLEVADVKDHIVNLRDFA